MPLNLTKGTGERLSHPAFMWLNQADTAQRTPREIYVSAHAENGSSVDTVLVDGRVVVEGGRITAFDADAILAEARPMLQAIRERNRDLLELARRMAEVVP
jgi:cytosine/adenosine deaminase-related metal-dependent hydrolase